MDGAPPNPIDAVLAVAGCVLAMILICCLGKFFERLAARSVRLVVGAGIFFLFCKYAWPAVFPLLVAIDAYYLEGRIATAAEGSGAVAWSRKWFGAGDAGAGGSSWFGSAEGGGDGDSASPLVDFAEDAWSRLRRSTA